MKRFTAQSFKSSWEEDFGSGAHYASYILSVPQGLECLSFSIWHNVLRPPILRREVSSVLCMPSQDRIIVRQIQAG